MSLLKGWNPAPGTDHVEDSGMAKDPIKRDRSVDPMSGNPTQKPREHRDIDEHAGDAPEPLPRSSRFSK